MGEREVRLKFHFHVKSCSLDKYERERETERERERERERGERERVKRLKTTIRFHEVVRGFDHTFIHLLVVETLKVLCNHLGLPENRDGFFSF